MVIWIILPPIVFHAHSIPSSHDECNKMRLLTQIFMNRGSLLLFICCMVNWGKLQSCPLAKASFGEKLEAKPYFNETVTNLLECYKNCREDGKCLSINYSTDKALCQRLRRSHKRPSRQTLRNITGWSYLLNRFNECKQDPYPCKQAELCEQTSTRSAGSFSCTHNVSSKCSLWDNNILLQLMDRRKAIFACV